ncbi:MAG: hypothetical protein ACLVLH_13410 [Eisenbergiella massiliensis]
MLLEIPEAVRAGRLKGWEKTGYPVIYLDKNLAARFDLSSAGGMEKKTGIHKRPGMIMTETIMKLWR